MGPEWLIDLLNFDRTRRHAKRFREIAEFARGQIERIDDHKGEGRDAVCAEGRDWDDLVAEIQPYEVE